MNKGDYGRRKYPSPKKYPQRKWWQSLVHYINSSPQRRRAEKKGQTPADKAARSSARATWIVALFTIVLAGVSSLQWREMQGSKRQTDTLLGLYQKQLAELQKQSTAMGNLATASGTQATQTTNLVAATQTSADAAKSAADTAKESLTSVQRPFVAYIPGVVDIGLGKMFARVEGNWDNLGITPAVKVWDRIHFEETKGFPQPPLNTQFPFTNDDSINEFVLGVHGRTSFYSKDLDNKEFSINGPFGYFYGWAMYEDSLHDTSLHTPLHLSEFCTITFTLLDPTLNRPSGISGRQASCRSHNCFDEGCKDYNARKHEVEAYEAAETDRRRPQPRQIH